MRGVLSSLKLATFAAFFLIAGVLASGLALDVGRAEPDPEPHKVFVCKYVGQPSVDERLQTGDNPISVSANAIPIYVKGMDLDDLVGQYFADAQGRSYVLAVDRGQPKPDASECPGGEPPPTDTTPTDTTPTDTTPTDTTPTIPTETTPTETTPTETTPTETTPTETTPTETTPTEPTETETTPAETPPAPSKPSVTKTKPATRSGTTGKAPAPQVRVKGAHKEAPAKAPTKLAHTP